MSESSRPASLVSTARPLPPFAVLGDLRRAALLGSAAGLPLAVLFGLLGWPDWAETLTSFVAVLGFFLVVSLLFRLGLHAVNAFVDAGRRRPDRRAIDVGISRWPVVVSGAFAVAWPWLVLSSGLTTGDWTP